MGRILAVDYGTKRVGLAVSDSLKMIANGLETVHAKDALDFICSYATKEDLECIVVGKPMRLNNQPPEVEKQIAGFVKKIQKALPTVQLERMDERFTSKIATSAMLAGGMKKKARQNKAMVDKVSATIILQDYLNSI